MRLWLILLVTGSLLIGTSTGCQSLNPLTGSSKSKKKSLFGLKRPGVERPDPDDILDPLGARDSNRILWDDLSPSQLATTIKAKTGGSDPENARKYYAEGQRIYKYAISQLDADPDGEAHKKSFDEAAKQFRLAGSSMPDSEIEENALYFEGESYFFADRYVQSNRAFEKLIANYSGTRHLDHAEHRRYAIAVYWLELADDSFLPNFTDAKRPTSGLANEARRVLHRIRIDDPTGKLADDATLALGKAFMKASRYYEAADTFEDLRKNYPGSKHQFTAHMLELEARLKGYQGKSYDDTPLRKADEIMKSIVQQFPRESKDQLEYLEKQATLIQNQIAERDFTMGEYFERRGENRAAKIYYEKVAEKYQNTPLGESINEKIEEVAALPPKPEQPVQWLVDVFPDPEAAKPMIRSGDNESIFR